MKENPIVIPLDGMTKGEAMKVATLLKGRVWGFKVNDLLLDCGVSIITELKDYGKVFADPKLYDIPNTVANSVIKLLRAGADLITVHASGGVEMMEAASEAIPESSLAKILAVTILTSFNEENVHLIYGDPIKAKVLQFTRDAFVAGVHGIVCSSQELTFLEKNASSIVHPNVIPGIRPTWHQGVDDQKRTMTPGEAMKLGANLLVIGRPILKDHDPVAAVERTLAEIEEALGAA